MQKPIGNLIFTLVLIVVLAAATYLSIFWPRDTKLFPTTMGVIALALSLIIFGRDIRRVYFSGVKTSNSSEEDSIDSFELAAAIGVLLWLLAFGVGIWVLGFHLAAFLFVFLFTKFRVRCTTLMSLAYAVGAAGGIYFLFVWVF